MRALQAFLLACIFLVAAQTDGRADVVSQNAGHFQIPSAPAAGVSVVSGAANNYTGTAIVLSASTSAIYITGVHVETSAALAATYISVQLMQGGSGAETSIGQYLVPLSTASTVALGFRPIFPPLKVAASTRLTVKTADSVGSKTYLVSVETILQSNVVDDGITVGTVNLVNTLTTYTGNTVQTGDSFARIGAAGAGLTALGDTRIANLDTTVSSRLATSGYTTPPTAAAIATAHWQDTTAGDFTVAASIGKSVMNGVALGTGLTINGYTGNTPQTGDSYARIGAAGAGLTALGDTRIAHLDADVSSRMATYTQPTGFLAATFPGTVASPTNITAGTITTVTTLTNLPSIPANWLTAAGIAASALNGKGDWLLSSSYTAPTNLTAAQISAGVWRDAVAADFTQAGSIGLSVVNGVSLGTGLTVANLTNLPSIPTNWLTATGIAAGALNGKGDWLLSSGYTAPDNAGVAAIKTKTDSLTFTVAGRVDANTRAINSVTVTGAGTSLSPWGP